MAEDRWFLGTLEPRNFLAQISYFVIGLAIGINQYGLVISVNPLIFNMYGRFLIQNSISSQVLEVQLLYVRVSSV